MKGWQGRCGWHPWNLAHGIEIEVEDQPTVALFDTGATYSYVRSSLVRDIPRRIVTRPIRVTLGGKDIEIRELCFIEGKIEGLDFFADAVPIEKVGHADEQELEALNGALTMERWEVRLDPKTGTPDLEGFTPWNNTSQSCYLPRPVE